VKKLDDFDITRTQSSRWQRLADMPEEKFETKVSLAKDKAVASIDKASSLAHRTSFTGDNQWFRPVDHLERARREEVTLARTLSVSERTIRDWLSRIDKDAKGGARQAHLRNVDGVRDTGRDRRGGSHAARNCPK
jgi:hypothetical protein